MESDRGGSGRKHDSAAGRGARGRGGPPASGRGGSRGAQPPAASDSGLGRSGLPAGSSGGRGRGGPPPSSSSGSVRASPPLPSGRESGRAAPSPSSSGWSRGGPSPASSSGSVMASPPLASSRESGRAAPSPSSSGRGRGGPPPASSRAGAPAPPSVGAVIHDARQQPQFGPGQRFVGRHPVVIGVSDRGRGHEYDLDVVALGTGAQVVSMGANHPNRLGDVHGVFIPGGRFNLPGTRTEPGGPEASAAVDPTHEPRTVPDAQDWRTRVDYQRALISSARDGGWPVLGVCGGSRAMAQCTLREEEGVGSTYLLPNVEKRRHNRAFNEPWHIAHDVEVHPDSGLGRIMRGEHWRDSRPGAPLQPLLTRGGAGPGKRKSNAVRRPDAKRWETAAHSEQQHALGGIPLRAKRTGLGPDRCARWQCRGGVAAHGPAIFHGGSRPSRVFAHPGRRLRGAGEPAASARHGGVGTGGGRASGD
jgi:hypothetical protein